ncbi:MAG: type I glyceraldehyde-3-phosphate dehydrogenase [Candidatus Dasytiphilus stammeri]
MNIKIGINGFGRIGRTIFRAAQKRKNLNIVAINDLLVPIDHLAYILKYDSTHGIFPGIIDVDLKNRNLIVNKKNILVTAEPNPLNLRWNTMGVEVVIEATGKFLTKELASKHLIAGAKKVVLTAPPKDDNIDMFVIGVNHNCYKGQKIISNASCTTNCLAPIVKILHENFIIIEGMMTTIHALTATQKIVDGISGKDWRLGRSGLQNIIPSSTGAAHSISQIIPSLKGKLTGMAFRVPVPNVSVIDLTVRLKNSANYETICTIMKEASETTLKGILGYNKQKLVSSDFYGKTFTSIFDADASIALNNNFFKIISWYDNEIGYSEKLLDLITLISNN